MNRWSSQGEREFRQTDSVYSPRRSLCSHLSGRNERTVCSRNTLALINPPVLLIQSQILFFFFSLNKWTVQSPEIDRDREAAGLKENKNDARVGYWWIPERSLGCSEIRRKWDIRRERQGEKQQGGKTHFLVQAWPVANSKSERVWGRVGKMWSQFQFEAVRSKSGVCGWKAPRAGLLPALLQLISTFTTNTCRVWDVTLLNASRREDKPAEIYGSAVYNLLWLKTLNVDYCEGEFCLLSWFVNMHFLSQRISCRWDATDFNLLVKTKIT